MRYFQIIGEGILKGLAWKRRIHRVVNWIAGFISWLFVTRRIVPNETTRTGFCLSCAFLVLAGPIAGIADGPPSPALAAVPDNSSLPTLHLVRTFDVKGIVQQINSAQKKAVISHEEIPGFMPKMVMEFSVQNTNELKGIIPGQQVQFQLKVDAEKSWIENLRKEGEAVSQSVAASNSDSSVSGLLQSSRLTVGTPFPDFELMTENGKVIKLSDYRGSAVAFTFIFTQCPLPDFCPRMNQNFSQARTLLMQKRSSPRNWEFLSISFDATYDTPEILSRYAKLYRKNNPRQWLFATAQPEALKKMEPLLDFHFTNEAGTFMHNLRTVVLDTRGRIYKQFDGNSWKAKELADAMVGAAKIDP